MIIHYLMTGLALIFVIVSHELAHGYVAYLFGDNTAKNRGRLSLNPLKHLDPIGTLFLLVFKFGWAKPVPIDERNFSSRRPGLFFVSIAGVTVNFITAVVSIFILLQFHNSLGVFSTFFELLAIYGIFFMVFNLIPIPPLDGSKVLASILPIGFQAFIYQFERYFTPILILFIMLNRQTGIISRISSSIFYFLVNNIAKIIM